MRAIREGRPSAVAARIKRVTSSGDPQSAAVVVAAARDGGDRAIELIVRALAKLECPVPEAVLIDVLDHHLRVLQLEAAAALKRTGTVHAVAPLEDWARRNLFDREIEASSRRAIAEIQSRVPGAAPGELSLVSPGGGELSFADEGKRGEVSLEESEKSGSG